MATYAEISLEEMDRFIMRGWRALRPKQVKERGTHVYDLFLSKFVKIRVWTTIPADKGTVRDVGETTIKIQLLSAHTGRPLLRGKSPIVKRVQGWRGNLQDRIEDYIEQYEEREDYFEAIAGNRQQQAEADRDDGTDHDEEDTAPPPRSEPPAAQPDAPASEPASEPEVWSPKVVNAPRDTDLQATFTKLRNGDWGLRVVGRAAPGDRVLARRGDGKRQKLVVGEIVWQGPDRDTGQTITVATIQRRTEREASEGAYEEEAYEEGEYAYHR